MPWIDELFGVRKPILAMLHLDPLPGDPLFKRGDAMKSVVEHARADLRALQSGGVDGIIFSNEFSLPYQRQMQFVTPAAMARVIGELMGELRVPFGVDCISDGLATIELAAAVDAAFVRGTFCGVYVGDGGLYNNDFSALLRRRAALRLDELKMLYFINPESDRNLDPRPLADIARSVIFKAAPDGLCVSASAAGQEVDDELMRGVKRAAPDVAVLCNTGCRLDNVAAKLGCADAAVVGTTFKAGGAFRGRVDAERVKAFMGAVAAYRRTL
ncbi:MAG TPA: BtpA/SgcQ family protein [Spirochaetales bacterium]|nr:BtpA/SgcQ family protein [Spirochaetales bacterium]HRY56483.1 BtpA/SgcQ family protein [Spirochaetia bacterium]HRZ63990.1 BtpA/SgcQ family protein [Spirochaetia bacterium]